MYIEVFYNLFSCLGLLRRSVHSRELLLMVLIVFVVVADLSAASQSFHY